MAAVALFGLCCLFLGGYLRRRSGRFGLASSYLIGLGCVGTFIAIDYLVQAVSA